MHPRLAELVDYNQAQRVALLTAVALVPETRREEQVSSDGWSVAQVLEHLLRVERGVVRLLTRALERAADVPAESEVSSILGTLDSFRLTDRALRISAPVQVLPRGEYASAQAIGALAESRLALLSVLGKGNGLALGKIIYPHPLLGSLDLYQWILFVGQHEVRHTAQIHEISQQLARR